MANRSTVDGNGNPNWVCSSPHQPAPIPNLDSTTRDLIDRGGRPCEDRRRAERYLRHEGSQAQTALSTDAVVRTEERLEPQPLSGLREREPVAPGDALLALDHQAEAHGA